MKSQSNIKPVMIERLNSTSYAFNYNVETKLDEDNNPYYVYEQVIINSCDINNNDIVRDTLLTNWDINEQIKLINDYNAYNLGLLKDEKYKTRYEDFLTFRTSMKENVDKNIL